MSSPKRKTEELNDDVVKKARTSQDDNLESEIAQEMAFTEPSNTTPDSLINHEAAIKYWSSTEPTVNGVLGGYPQVSRIDLQGSGNFLAKLRRQSKHFSADKKLRRAVDCGAGIGRITEGLLRNVAETVDIVEPVKSFTDQANGKAGVGEIYNVGLEAWHPEKEGRGPYDLIWNQWCLGQLTDAQLVDYLKRLPAVLSEGGWIVVKENLSNDAAGNDIFDEVDSSVSRTDTKFRNLFEDAGLRLLSTELQKGFPKGLFPVRVYALVPR
ncbi:hypothetical protein B0A50_01647 [Salinomyces thailandicus]|uniref:Alpha N-terminal protein methyltransferase 1 n=1 Tax=Salinomyces thailandicus TaxID=706561 RepID=A0A4V5N5N6_9PEZI|nr:hypothetical protein B0A50_01647 [Salinomyces thailandica]